MPTAKCIMRYKLETYYTFGNAGIICMFENNCDTSKTSSFVYMYIYILSNRFVNKRAEVL